MTKEKFMRRWALNLPEFERDIDALIGSTLKLAADKAGAWLHVPTMKLRAGEMTAGEVRVARAVVAAIVTDIQLLGNS